MSLSIGIIGLPNVGKSTTFNALIKEQQASAENYPFCTIEPNKATVPVPDKRLEKLGELVNVNNVIHSTIGFVDVAGLVKGASQGEGLGNKFLGHIRDVDAILHVVRCFDDDNVVHVSGKPDPEVDIEVINTELALSDLSQLEKRLEKLEREVKGDAKLRSTFALAGELREYLASGQPLWRHPAIATEDFQTLNRELRFLTAKPVIYAANVDEGCLASDNEYVKAARSVANIQGAQIFKLCAGLEADLVGMSDVEREEYLALAGIRDGGLEKIIRSSYETLNLISYFTFNENETRAWAIKNGTSAPEAAGIIHTDFERGFIKAEIVPFDLFDEHRSWKTLKSEGLLRIEGREYFVEDGDVILFRFNV